MSPYTDIILTAFLSDYVRMLHVREIARLVKMNRQTVSETLREMEESRILDSEVSGRHKLYFINSRSLSAKFFLQQAENKRRIEICSKKNVISRLISYLDPKTIAVLFGSYAKGTEKADSDIDLLIISDRKPKFARFEKETGKTVQAFHMKKEEFLNRFFRKDPLVMEAVKDHICLRDVEGLVDILWEANYGR